MTQDPATANWFRAAARRWRGTLRSIYFRGSRFGCTVCGRSARRFRPHGRIPRPDARCPFCHSLERHRLLWSYLQLRTPLFDGRPRSLLHFAPEASLEKRLRALSGLRYVSADLEPGRADLAADITRLELPSRSFDVVFCSHVLEHVPDDRRALSELARILKLDGWAILMVPIEGEVTIEDPNVTDPAERLYRFGQEDHVRVYGRDIVARLVGAGLNVLEVRARDVLSGDALRLAAIPDDGNQVLFHVRPIDPNLVHADGGASR